MTAYLKEGLKTEEVSKVEKALHEVKEFDVVRYISKEEARSKFSNQMANYAPDLLKDDSIANPFPASFEMTFISKDFLGQLDEIAKRVGQVAGIEDVSYGQDWVSNYASIVNGFWNSSLAIATVLVFGSLLVIGNSIRTSVAHRKEEIEILKLVGATDSMVRTPFVVEGAFMGLIASSVAMVFSFVFYTWAVKLLADNMSFLNLSSNVRFLPWSFIVFSLLGGVAVGAFGSYFCVRRLSQFTGEGEARG
jgi:cell division transport system permease protein